MNGKILELFMKENDAWDDMITRQSKEIPNLEKMLTSMVEKKPYVAEEILSSIRILKNEMQEQETSSPIRFTSAVVVELTFLSMVASTA